LVATNTIGQGDTRATGLRSILAGSGIVLRAERRREWPGDAAVVVSVIHVLRGRSDAFFVPQAVLDNRAVARISAFLVEGDLDSTPAALAAISGRSFIGSVVLGMGFTFDDLTKRVAIPTTRMKELLAKDVHNASRIKPYIGGEELNNDPVHAYHRWVID